jgi:hypothetical protein
MAKQPILLSARDLDRLGRVLHDGEREDDILRLGSGDTIRVKGATFNFDAFMETLKAIVPHPESSFTKEYNDLFRRDDGTDVPFDQLTREEMITGFRQLTSTIRTQRGHINFLRERQSEARSDVIREIAAHVSALAEKE